MTPLTRRDVMEALAEIDDAAREHGTLVDLAIYGGAALMLAYDIRHSTRDVDAVVMRGKELAERVSAEVSQRRGWQSDWLNDGVKGFVSSRNEMDQLMSMFPDANADVGGLRVYVPTPEYFFAMKCMAMRMAGVDHPGDIGDIRALAKIAGIDSYERAITVVESYYPSKQISPKVQFGLQEIMGMDHVLDAQASAPDTGSEPTPK